MLMRYKAGIFIDIHLKGPGVERRRFAAEPMLEELSRVREQAHEETILIWWEKYYNGLWGRTPRVTRYGTPSGSATRRT